MTTADVFKQKILDPAIEAGDVSKLEQIAPAWKNFIDAEKAEMDIADALAKRRSEGVRFWVPILAPIVSALALIGTLLLQVNQFGENARMAAQTVEDAAWRDLLNRARDQKGPDSAFAVSMLRNFLDSERYGKAARVISTQILGRMIEPDVFNVLFPDIVKRTDVSQIGDIANIGANLNRGYRNIDAVAPGAPPADKRRITEGIGKNVVTTGKALKGLLEKRRNADPRPLVDLTDVQFPTLDLSNEDFGGTNIQGALFYRCDVTGAIFSDVLEFEGSDWEGTVWWNAKAIDANLLEYLEINFPYEKDWDYRGDKNANPEAYSKALSALKRKKA